MKALLGGTSFASFSLCLGPGPLARSFADTHPLLRKQACSAALITACDALSALSRSLSLSPSLSLVSATPSASLQV